MERNFYKKWWFWVIILIIVVVAFSSIIIVAIGKVTLGESGIAMQIQNIYEGATLYSSAGEKELILKIKNHDDIKNTQKPMQMINIIKENSKDTLKNYEKLIVFSYLQADEKQTIVDVYSMPDFSMQKHNTYIKFDEYEKLFNTLKETTDSYTGLFNSIY